MLTQKVSGENPRVCISNKLPDDAEAADLRTTVPETRLVGFT